jgi:hypothetical protein
MDGGRARGHPAKKLQHHPGDSGKSPAREAYRLTREIRGDHRSLVLRRIAGRAYPGEKTRVAGVRERQPWIGEPSGMTLNLEAVQAENGVSSVYEGCLRQEKGDVWESEPEELLGFCQMASAGLESFRRRCLIRRQLEDDSRPMRLPPRDALVRAHRRHRPGMTADARGCPQGTRPAPWMAVETPLRSR